MPADPWTPPAAVEEWFTTAIRNSDPDFPNTSAVLLLRALHAAGFAVLPIDPHDGMIEAAGEIVREHDACGIRTYATDVYAAMVAAAERGP